MFSLGVVLLAALGWLLARGLRDTRLGPGALPTEGEIVEFDEQFVGSDGGMITRLRVRFCTAGGEVVTAPTPTGSALARLRFRRGQRVPVRYDPQNPQRFEVAGFDGPNRRVILVIFALVAAGLGLLGGLLYVLAAVLPR